MHNYGGEADGTAENEEEGGGIYTWRLIMRRPVKKNIDKEYRHD